MPKLSIITINLNNQEGLKKTIQSVVSQSHKDFEYLVIDGGSTDGSVDVIKQYENHIGYWVSEKDKGIYNAMNKGILKAQGEYLLFLNSGDYLYNSDVLKNVFDFNYNHDIIYGDLFFLLVDTQSYNVIIRQEDFINKSYFLTCSLPHPCSFIKKELFLLIGLYDESFKIAADYDFFINAIVNHKVSFKRVPTVISVFNNQGISCNKQFEKLRKQENKKAIKKNYSKKDYYSYFCKPKIREIKEANINFLKTLLRKFLIKIGFLKRHH